MKIQQQLHWPMKVLNLYPTKDIIMQSFSSNEQQLIEKIRALPLSQRIEVEDFVDFLNQRRDDRQMVLSATQLSEPAFARIWDNPEDAAYDDL
jgi:hypothetical protein